MAAIVTAARTERQTRPHGLTRPLRPWFIPPALVAVLLLAGGCNQGASGVAVVDLDVVAAAIGRDVVIENRIKLANEQLTNQVVELANDLQAKLRVEQAELGEDASAEEQSAFESRTAQANRQLQQTQQLARQRSDQVRAAIVKEFRAEVAPIATKVARARGVSVVLTAAVPMVWYDPAIDVTDEVIAAMRAVRPGDAPAEPTSPASGAGTSNDG